MCDLGAVGDAETDECEDTQFGIELLPWLELYLLVLTEERIEVLDEGREEVDEGRVEAVVELYQLRLDLLIIRGEGLLDLLRLASAEELTQTFTEALHLLQIGRALIHVLGDIGLFEVRGLGDELILPLHLLVVLHERAVDLIELTIGMRQIRLRLL